MSNASRPVSEQRGGSAAGIRGAQSNASSQNQQFLSFVLARHARGVPLRLSGLALVAAAAFGVASLILHVLGDLAPPVRLCLAVGASAAVFAFALRHLLGAQSRAIAAQSLASALLDANRECIKLLDVNGRMLRISEFGAELMQATSPEALAGANWLGFWSGDDAAAASAAFDGALRGARTSFTGACATTKGGEKWWHSRLIPIMDARNQRVLALLCASSDVTREKKLSTDLRAKEQLMSEMETHVRMAFYSYSADFSYFHHVSAGSCAVFGIDPAVLHEHPTAWLELVLPDDLPPLQAEMSRIVAESTEGRIQYRIRRADGAVRWIRSTGFPVRDEAGTVTHIVGISEDVTAEHEYLAELDRLAYSDALTGLANRSALVRRIEERCAAGLPFGLMFIDLDRFKVLNDTLGHTAADRLLREIGDIIKAALPQDAYVARLGGDEFAALLSAPTERTRLSRAAESVLAALAESGRLGRAEAFVTASIGISMYPQDGADQEALLTNADIAMYAAKKAGRNGFRFTGKHATERIIDFELERDLPAALAGDQFVLHYQSIHEPRSLDVHSVEALIRWRHPTRGLISPSVFIPILEESGFIVQVGGWVIDRALGQLARWRQAGATALGVSINVSARQLVSCDIVEVVNEALRRHGVPHSSLQIEITESALMENPTLAQETLSALRQLGVRVAIDDFGTGHSSLRYLADFAPHALKLDRSFIARMPSDDSIRMIVRGMIDISHGLGVRVIAEGVEHAAQLDMLIDAHCDLIQGYHLSRPLPAEQIMGLTARGATMFEAS
ncbi:putative bifunctional diguanylate cyclase/phosphodiesterase [Caballeronia ptereochthonis]|uniref:Diguanylate cyclase/phosphodiesterase with PAS/PAC and GAF sensor(S) n=1 Tax=Caballeronia ptereochthonis TaxID=1777144 RepID=A0A158E845_9BURK|nr:GGDEF and EAL domain-containing protein [Caballeronia ptereochthonis]SAL02880.1 diguanylate cyclase/phosphodiesterase with PAS/PAC and GAF sensor(s) [Caballeronia ptereochthonis]